jgi:acyl-[acyl-carrier-protein]-phospholipid O-acyltransferase/long-chain-fatty-acid--[acyl-carrier-protein] ligase
MNTILKVLFNKKLMVALAKLFLRVQVKGIENIKGLKGKVLFVANHNSFLDTFLLWAFIPENLCFTINPIVAKKWYIKPLLNVAKFFQIEPNNPMAVKSIIREINNGHKIVIYPEGRVTATGSMMKIYPGPAMIADKTNAQIVPVYIDGTQYSIFSYYRNKVNIKPRVKVVLTIFKPTKLNTDKNLKGEERKKEITKQLFDIMTNARYFSLSDQKTLFESLIETKNFVGRRTKIVEDISRKPINYGQLLTAAFVLGKQFTKYSKQKEMVGFLLPNAVASVVAIFGMQAYNIIPCMLNFSTGTKNMISCCKTANIKTVYTSKQFVIKGGFEELTETMKKEGLKIIYLEDLKKEITLKEKLIGFFASFFPKYYYNKIKGNVSVEEPAVILFTSGSEGT